MGNKGFLPINLIVVKVLGASIGNDLKNEPK